MPNTKTQAPDQATEQQKVELLELTKKAEVLGELILRKRLLGIYQESMLFKSQHCQRWGEFIDFLRGRQWPLRRPSYKISATVNLLLEMVERKTALLTDAKPRPRVVPVSDEYQDTADLLNRIMDIVYTDSSFNMAMTDLVENAQVFGSGFIGTPYDKEADNGRGAAVNISYDPRAVYFDPLVLKSYMLCKGEYIIIEDIWPLEKARDLYPKRADIFKADASLSRYEIPQQQGMFSGFMSRIFRPRESQAVASEIPRVYVREFYYRDRSREGSGKYTFTNSSRKTFMVGEIIADDGSNPYRDGEFPIDMLGWHTDYDSAWSWGDVELHKNPQEIHNKILATLVENIMLMSNAIWVGDADALSKEEWDRLSNAPGQQVKKRPGRELRRESGVPIPPHVMNTLEYMERVNEKLSGLVDVMRGIRTGQVSSGVGIEALQMTAQALIRLRSRSIETLQSSAGKKTVSRIFQFYEPKYIFQILKSNSEYSEPEGMKAIVSDLLKPTTERAKDAFKTVVFTIEPGSSLGLAKQERKVESFRLREMNVIDDKALLADIEYPHREQVLKRTEQKRQDAMNQEVPPNQKEGSAKTQFPNQSGGSPAGE